jgi:hypothetical protein
MIVFNYIGVLTPKNAQTLLSAMDIPGEACERLIRDGMLCVWKGNEFMAMFYPEERRLELYGTKNTNSINYYINRFERLNWHTWNKVKTKRW